jgi:hypothetical protein
MEKDFLILLVNRANAVVLDESRTGWLRIRSFFMRLHAAVSEDEDVP